MFYLDLHWTPLLALSEFPPEPKAKPISAVYIWGFIHNESFLPYYVGRTGKPFERAMQHYAGLWGGLYPIYHRDSPAQFHHHKNDHKRGLVDPAGERGMIYTPSGPRALWDGFASRPKVRNEVCYLLGRFRFAYAEIKGGRGNDDSDRKACKNLRDIAERAVADVIGRERLQATVARSCVARYELDLRHGGGDAALRRSWG